MVTLQRAISRTRIRRNSDSYEQRQKQPKQELTFIQGSSREILACSQFALVVRNAAEKLGP